MYAYTGINRVVAVRCLVAVEGVGALYIVVFSQCLSNPFIEVTMQGSHLPITAQLGDIHSIHTSWNIVHLSMITNSRPTHDFHSQVPL